ncbi:MAG: amidohydrolase family protein [Acidimicrobiia bacterium]
MFETKLPYPVFDADNHFYEPPDAIDRYIDPKFRDRIAVDYRPDVAKKHRERMAADSNASITPVPGTALYKANPLRAVEADERAKVVESFRWLEPSYQDRDTRIDVMDVQGLQATIMFPTGIGVWVSAAYAATDPEANAANVRAYNQWVQDDWGFDYKGRILTPANVPLGNIDLMVAELDRALAAGARTVILPAGPLNGRSPGSPYFDPFWARLEEAGVPAVVHLGYTQYQEAGRNYGYNPNQHYHDGFDAFQWFSYWGDRPIMETVAAMIFHNLFTRFPNLKVGIIEHGSVWAPYALRKMDHGFMMGRPAQNGKLTERPSDVFRKHFVVAPYPEEGLARVLDILPVDNLVFGSDFPHPEGLPDPVTYVNQLTDLSEADQRKIMSTNLANFLGIKV